MLDLKKTAIVVCIFVSACQQTPQKTRLTTDSLVEPAKMVSATDSPLVDDNQVLTLLLTAEIAIQRKQYDVALDAYIQAAELVDDERIAEKATRLGVYLDELGKTDKAVNLWLKQDPKNMTARRIALSVALKLQEPELLVKHLDVVLQQSPAAFESLLVEIQKSLKNDADVQFFYDSLEALSKKHSQQAVILLSQSLLAARQDKIELSREKIQQALKAQPDWEKALEFQAELYIHSGKLAYKEKKLDEALMWFDKVNSKKQAFDAAIAGITVLGELKDFNQASTRLQKLLKAYPKQRTRLMIMRAELYNEQKEYKKAFTVLSNILKKSPKDKAVLYSRALTAEKLDDLVTLEKDLLKILDQDPEDVGALNALGYTLADKTQRYEEAEKYLKQALELKPDEAVIIDSYGWLLYKKGKVQESLGYLEKAHQQLPENEIIAHLAEVLWVLGRKEEAEKLIMDAMSKMPEDEYLLDFKQRFLDNVK